MGSSLSALVTLFILAAVVPPLRNKFFAAHIALTVIISWLVQPYISNYVNIFSARSFRIFLGVHIVLINITTWLAYYFDKRASIKQDWRIPEKTLHTFALIGGTPAALYAQKKLRHKNRKKSFQTFSLLILGAQALLIFIMLVI